MAKVIKRDGRVVEFNQDKIVDAINKAFVEVTGAKSGSANEIARVTMAVIGDKDEIHVEDIQDQVENTLMDYDTNVAKAYIRYRYLHNIARNDYDELMSVVDEKINVKHAKNQNANVDEYSFGGRIGEASNAIMKKFALDYCMSEKTRKNHENNEIYIHDLDRWAVGSHNCLTLPLDDLLKNGFNTRQVDIRPANSVGTAFQLVAVLFQIQSLQQFGGVAAGHLDWTMVPYVRKSFKKHFVTGLKYFYDESEYKINNETSAEEVPIDSDDYKYFSKAYAYASDMTEKEVRQAVEGMFHNLNSLQSRSGNQLPFSSINFGTCTFPEGRMITRAILDGSIKGVGKLHKTSIFPCTIFQCMNGVNRKPGDTNYDLFQLALKSTAMRLYPNYANVDWTGNVGYDKNDPRTYFATMGCRTANGLDVNGFGQLKDGRGNIAPTTIILPTVAMVARESAASEDAVIYEFMRILDEKLHEAKDSLIERFEWICSQNPKSATFMWENNTMAGYDQKEGPRSALKHGTLAIGMIGIAETLQILIGCDHTTKEGLELAKEICGLYKKRCAEFKEEYKLNFGVYYTPKCNK